MSNKRRRQVLDPKTGKWWMIPNDPAAEKAVERFLAMTDFGQELACAYLEGWYDGMKNAGY
jgi:hypothetical protein